MFASSLGRAVQLRAAHDIVVGRRRRRDDQRAVLGWGVMTCSSPLPSANIGAASAVSRAALF
jgi:hypothetical protein